MAARVIMVLVALLAPAVLASSQLLDQLSSSQFTGFLSLLEQADLVPELEAAVSSGNGVTIFCPSDDALMTSTSPTLLAFLKMPGNKPLLRKVLLNHVVTERLSPFQWEGTHPTLDNPIKLTMDASAFYAGGVPVAQYNALQAGESSIHSIPTLIVPASVAEGAKSLVVENTTVRRVLVAAEAPSPAGGEPVGGQKPTPVAPGGTTTDTPSPSAARGSVAVSAFALVAVALAAALV